jgi:hypothetical protein
VINQEIYYANHHFLSRSRRCIALIICGGLAGIAAVLATSFLYLPSYVVCVLKLRSGVIPLDKHFRALRKNTEEASILFGSALWGCVLSATISAIVVGSIAFLTVWEESRTVMLAIFGHLVGWALTVGIKMLFLLMIRGLYVKALYRDRPGASNVVNLALECWHIGLAAGYIFFQAICLLTQTTIAIGHADTALPQAFRKDLVVSEAHRHPYIQRLTVFYLTKLRHGPKFCTRAGSCWRLIYVLALMPWLKKYRPGFENYDMATTNSIKQTTAGRNECAKNPASSPATSIESVASSAKQKEQHQQQQVEHQQEGASASAGADPISFKKCWIC